MVQSCCCPWNRNRKDTLHSAQRLKRSRSLEKVNLGKYTSVVLEDKYLPPARPQSECLSDKSDKSYRDIPIMGNSLSPESLEDNNLKKTESSVSLKSSSSVKSSASRRSKVTFTPDNPEVHMIPPKSPPKPKRTKGNKVPIYDDVDISVGDNESESAFQFDLSNKAELTSIEDLSGLKSKPSKKSKKEKCCREEEPQVTGLCFLDCILSAVIMCLDMNYFVSFTILPPLITKKRTL